MNGLVRFDGATWKAVPIEIEGRSIGEIMSLAAGRSDTLWAGARYIQDPPGIYSGHLVALTAGMEASISIPDANLVSSIAIDSVGSIWIAMPQYVIFPGGTVAGGGVAAYDGRFRFHGQGTGELPGRGVIDIAVDVDNTIWAATHPTWLPPYEIGRGGAGHFDRSRWQGFDTSNSPLTTGYIDFVHIDRRGNKFFGGMMNVFVYNENGVVISDLDAGNPPIPASFTLHQNYPNPFNPRTTIHYSLPRVSPVTITVYNIVGERVATLVDGVREPGRHTVVFDASALSGGVYICRLLVGDSFSDQKKMLYVK
jgi:hypothetical protein